jgi:hypothetical protein
MSSADDDWLRSGRGTKPTLRWSFITDAPLTDVQLARETGDVVACDMSGALYLFDRRGHIRSLIRTGHELRQLAWSDIGTLGVALINENSVGCFDRQLQFRWMRELQEETTAVALSPYGTHIAVGLANSENVIYDAENRRVSRFTSLRPLKFLQFLHAVPELVVAAEHACFARYKLNGDPVWMEKLFSNVGDLSVTGDGRYIFLAGFAYGVQVFDADGDAIGSFVLDGAANLVSSTYSRKWIVAATLERQLICLDSEGKERWLLELPEELCGVRLSPLGDWLICGFASGRIVRLDQTM